MGIRLLGFLFSLVFLITLGGCASTRKNHELQIQDLRNQITVLEIENQQKDELIDGLKEALKKRQAEKQTAAQELKAIGEVKSRPTAKQIQIALRNAGFHPGPIDGKIGRQTRQAIKAFQRANNLSVDGKVGKKTWSLLRDYLYTKAK